ncbi:hypothetical protein [uncultured Rikenella sp.]|uniref:hypothetical protein n=1 Tax=uncultured Rikenella sp. TaxID=368003 RepID=UPI0025FB8999|nr:hypothetical protein [uncultured Rikenella sp.]
MLFVLYRSAGRGSKCPAPGYRERTNGGLEGVGSNGLNWASTDIEPNAVFLFFRPHDLYPNYASYRAHGLLLRCLSE